MKSSEQIPQVKGVPKDFFNLYSIIKPYTMIDSLRLSMLYILASEICSNGIKGDVVECGVCNGGSAAILAEVIKTDVNRKLWLYDTFSGMPSPVVLDGDEAKKYEGKLVGSIGNVKNIICDKIGFPMENIIIKKGLFLTTFKSKIPQSISLLHIDADWYNSVLLSLETFYPMVNIGGIIILDDFGHWEGAREAFYDFCFEQNIKPLLERVGYTQAFWRKGTIHNRLNRK